MRVLICKIGHIKRQKQNTLAKINGIVVQMKHCESCGKEISKEEYESYAGLCWECWDDQMTEECEFEEDII